jgi:5'-nucleotidase
MAFNIDDKLVVGISSSALFNLEKEDAIFREKGLAAYIDYQIVHRDDPISKGLAFPFVKRLLNLNIAHPAEQPVEVVLLSRNSPATGVRIFNSIREYDLNITRAAFMSGSSPYPYIKAFNISLFLSTNSEDVYESIRHNYPAGLILKSSVHDNTDDDELRVAFDFDGVIADDSAEQIYQKEGIQAYREHERQFKRDPLNPGIVSDFFRKLSSLQKLETDRAVSDPSYHKKLRISVVTARNAPAHERAINTLSSWNVSVDEMFLLGGIEKRRILEVLKPHLYIDDQTIHLDQSLNDMALVHIPISITNKGTTP